MRPAKTWWEQKKLFPEQMSEKEVTAAILEKYGAVDWCFMWKNQTGVLTDIRGQFVSFGLKGSADIFCVVKPLGRFAAIEVKRGKGGVQSVDQKRFQRIIEMMGGTYILASSLKDVESVLPRLRASNKSNQG